MRAEALELGLAIRHLPAQAFGGRPTEARLAEGLRAAGKQWCCWFLFWNGAGFCAWVSLVGLQVLEAVRGKLCI